MAVSIAPFRRLMYRQISQKVDFTPGILSFSKKARPLREWARDGVIHADIDKYPPWTRQLERQKKELNKRKEKILKEQQILNSFYKELGFDTLPRNHPLSREWEQKIGRLRKAVEKIKKKQQLRSKKASVTKTPAVEVGSSPAASPKPDIT
ncbi:hypothetical protein FGB62_7g655 [Gracilaria domingensis]|nr:hypothetical protein FGB62_7g655 [Gracilaria domingensis]